jgi:hypothetical protein
MSYQQAASRIKAEDGNGSIILPVDTMEVMAEPFVPEDGTLQRDYDGTAWFEAPTFRLKLTLEWAFERTDKRPTVYDTLQDLTAAYMNGRILDFFVKYDRDTSSYDSDYFCPNMIPMIQDDDAGIMFQEQAREKNRKIELESQSSQLTWPEVNFTYD